MKRREFLSMAAAVGVAGTLPRAASGQQPSKLPRIAWLSLPLVDQYVQALPQGLAKLGHLEGKTFVFDVHTPASNAALQAAAIPIVSSSPDVIVTYGTFATQAVRSATAAIPIVFVAVADPLGAGLVTNLARPGGNVTGTSLLAPDLIGKQVAMLKELVPRLQRFAVPVFPAISITALYTPQVRAASLALDMEPVFIDFTDGPDIEGQFQRVFSAGVQGALCLAYNELNIHRDTIFDLHIRNRMPLLYCGAVVPGSATPAPGVVTFAADIIGIIRTRGAAIVDAILRGARPGELPVEQPTIFDLAVDLVAARKIGVSVPTSILAQATLVIDHDIRALNAPPR